MAGTSLVFTYGWVIPHSWNRVQVRENGSCLDHVRPGFTVLDVLCDVCGATPRPWTSQPVPGLWTGSRISVDHLSPIFIQRLLMHHPIGPCCRARQRHRTGSLDGMSVVGHGRRSEPNTQAEVPALCSDDFPKPVNFHGSSKSGGDCRYLGGIRWPIHDS